MSKPPLSDHEARHARAMKALRDANQHLEEIAWKFKAKFHSDPSLDQFFLGAVSDDAGQLHVGATVFFVSDTDIAESETNGTAQAMRNFIYEKLEEYGRGKRDELDVQFEFDSLENVQKNYEGSYFLRMR